MYNLPSIQLEWEREYKLNELGPCRPALAGAIVGIVMYSGPRLHTMSYLTPYPCMQLYLCMHAWQHGALLLKKPLLGLDFRVSDLREVVIKWGAATWKNLYPTQPNPLAKSLISFSFLHISKKNLVNISHFFPHISKQPLIIYHLFT